MSQHEREVVGNWGRWGDDDERGALNLITPEVITNATNLVKKGKIYSLSIPVQRYGVPVFAERERGRPFHFMRVDGGDYAAGAKRMAGIQVSDDSIFLAPHGVTHIDALCHEWFDDKLYNGFSGSTVRSTGARHCGIDKALWIVTRGILLDIAKYKGVDCLEKNYAITLEDLDNCAKAEGMSPKPGDVLLVRTGWLNHYSKEPDTWEEQQPGIGVSTLPWIVENEFCALGADNGTLEVWPAEDKNKVTPCHAELLRNRGVYAMELLYLDELASDQVYEFLFVAAPLKITGGTGSPLNPLAII